MFFLCTCASIYLYVQMSICIEFCGFSYGWLFFLLSFLFFFCCIFAGTCQRLFVSVCLCKCQLLCVCLFAFVVVRVFACACKFVGLYHNMGMYVWLMCASVLACLFQFDCACVWQIPYGCVCSFAPRACISLWLCVLLCLIMCLCGCGFSYVYRLLEVV